MKFFDRIFGGRPVAADRDPLDDHWFMPVSRSTAAGMPVTIETSMTLPVVYDCLKVLSGSIGSLPFAIFERGPERAKQRSDGHPLMRVLTDPNDETDAVEFITQLVWDLASAGNFYAEILQGDIGPISQLWRLEPSLVTVERLADGSRRWVYQDPGGQTRRFVEGEIWHIRVPPLSRGLTGASPIHIGREAVSAALALQDYGARFFRNDATPPYFLEHPTFFKDDVSRENYVAFLKRMLSGRNRHNPGILEHGIKFTRAGASNEEAQFLQTRNALDLALTRLWHMQPHKVGILDKATFSNIEQQSLEFVTDTLLPWLRLIEKSVAKHLILNNGRFFFEFNVLGLLRGDIKTRFEAYSRARQWGWLSVNEIRRFENMNPVVGGDAYLQPLNMVPSGNDPRMDQTPDATILGPDGTEVSRVVGGEVIRLRDYHHAA